MISNNIGRIASEQQFFSQTRTSLATSLGPTERKTLSLQVLTRSESVSHLAQNYQVSRKFLYQQAAKASDALDEAFTSSTDNDRVLFYLPVTKNWIRQFVLALILICHSSFRGILELLEAVFDYNKLSLGTIHNIVRQAVQKAKQINGAQDLSGIDVGIPDEIFQARQPVLVGMDARSTYCYLLSDEDQRDETTWGVHLLDLAAQGLHPDYTIADGGRGLRAGQAAAWDDVPCHGDVFHAERDLGKLAFFLENRAAGCTTMCQKLERKMNRAKNKGKGRPLSKKLAYARQVEKQAIELAKNIRTLPIGCKTTSSRLPAQTFKAAENSMTLLSKNYGRSNLFVRIALLLFFGCWKITVTTFWLLSVFLTKGSPILPQDSMSRCF